MLSKAYRTRFILAAQTDGQLIERVITEFYTDYSETWAEPRYVVDGGAHGGYHTFRFAPLANVRKVFAFEANSDTFEILQRGWMSKEHNDKVHLTLAALQDDPRATHVEFHRSKTHPGRSGIRPVMRSYSDTPFDAPVSVQALTLDRALANARGRCGFIKLDLEGGEYCAFKGARKILKDFAPACVFENGAKSAENYGYTAREFIDMFERADMQVVTAFGDVADDQNLYDFWYAWSFPKSCMEECVKILEKSFLAVFPNES